MDALDDWIGREERRQDVATAATLARFRATLDSEADGDIVPPGFHWCLCLPDAPTAGLGADGHPAKGGFLPPVDLPRRMWAGSVVVFAAPIRVGAAIDRVSRVVGIEEKLGATGRLVFVEVEHVTFADGVEAVLESQHLVYRAPASVPLAMPAAMGADLAGWEWQRSLVPNEALLFRYSALTFNSHRIHFDLPYAQGEEGYPGLVVHGPLTATLLLDLLARAVGAERIEMFRFRGVAPAFAGQPLHLVARPGAEGAIELVALGGDGRAVMQARATLYPPVGGLAPGG